MNGSEAPVDPARWRYRQALAARMAGQPEAVRRLLQQKLDAEREADARCRPGTAAPSSAPCCATGQASTPLADLNAYIRSLAAARQGTAASGEAPHDELASVRRFRQSWECGRTLDQLEQALARTPANAGPLNSHALVLRSLGLMGGLSTDYLRRFLAYAETLQWLEKAREKYPKAAAPGGGARPARRGRKRK